MKNIILILILTLFGINGLRELGLNLYFNVDLVSFIIVITVILIIIIEPFYKVLINISNAISGIKQIATENEDNIKIIAKKLKEAEDKKKKKKS